MIEVLAQIEDEVAHVGRHEVGFNMESWWIRTGCGTTACLAGHAVLSEDLYPHSLMHVRDRNGIERSIEELGREILGLTFDEAIDMFYLGSLDAVYDRTAELMGVDEVVLRDKVQAARHG